MSTGSVKRHNASARRKMQPAPGGRMKAPGDRVAHRLAAPVHRQTVDAEVSHCFFASAWR